jgi:GNAT superfamily N-acetyltransferase
MRPYQTEADYWRIREFLRGVSLLNDRHDYAWPLLRWDYWRWHVNENIFKLALPDVISVWEKDGQIVATLNPDSPGEAFFQVHPAFHERGLISEMLEVAEGKLPRTNDAGQEELLVWVNEADDLAKKLFTERGYVRSKFLAEHMRCRIFTAPLPASVPRPDTPSAHWATKTSSLPVAGSRGRPFIPMSPTRTTRVGIGTKTCSAFHSIAAILTSSLWRRLVNWPPSAPSGSTM